MSLWIGGTVVGGYGCTSRGRCLSVFLLSPEDCDPAGPRLLERLHLVDKNSEDMQRVTHGSVLCADEAKGEHHSQYPVLLLLCVSGRHTWENTTKYTNY